MTAPTSIDETAPVIARHEIEIAAPLATVWGLHTDINAWPTWQTEVTSARIVGPLEPGATFAWSTFGLDVTSTVYRVEEHSGTLWGGPASGIDGVHEWIFRETPTGVRVSTSESWSGPPVDADAATLQAQLDASLVSWLRHLKAAAEAAS
jgi:hypothetical protein